MINLLQTAKNILLLFISAASWKLSADCLCQSVHIVGFLNYIFRISQTIFQLKHGSVCFFFIWKLFFFRFIFLYFILQYSCFIFQSILPSYTAFSLTGQKNKPLHTIIQTFSDLFVIGKLQLFSYRNQKFFQFPDLYWNSTQIIADIIQILLYIIPVFLLAFHIQDSILIVAIRHPKPGKQIFIFMQRFQNGNKQIQTGRKVTFRAQLPYFDTNFIQFFPFCFCERLLLS